MTRGRDGAYGTSLLMRFACSGRWLIRQATGLLRSPGCRHRNAVAIGRSSGARSANGPAECTDLECDGGNGLSVLCHREGLIAVTFAISGSGWDRGESDERRGPGFAAWRSAWRYSASDSTRSSWMVIGESVLSQDFASSPRSDSVRQPRWL